MKARVKATGEIVEVEDCSADMYVEKFGEMSGGLFHITELDFDNLESPDYWTRLEHLYAGMAMQGFLASGMENTYEYIAEFSANQAHALVEKLKSNE